MTFLMASTVRYTKIEICRVERDSDNNYYIDIKYIEAKKR